MFDDQVTDTLFGGGDQDWFFETGYLGIYRPFAANTSALAESPSSTNITTAHSQAQIIVDTLPELEGFAFVDSLDKLGDRQTNEKIHSLVPHADNPTLQREHLTLFELIRYDQATHIAIRNGAWSDPATWQNGQLPTAGARVLIPIGVEVQVDGVVPTRLATVRVDGTLSFNTAQEYGVAGGYDRRDRQRGL